MTVAEALAQADALRPNEFEAAVKLRWLSTLDGQIHRELLGAFQEEPAPFSGYGEQTEIRSTQLLVPYPYDELYPRYLAMRIDLEHGELERYNNDAASFNRLWRSFAAAHCRSHSPRGVTRLRF